MSRKGRTLISWRIVVRAGAVLCAVAVVVAATIGVVFLVAEDGGSGSTWPEWAAVCAPSGVVAIVVGVLLQKCERERRGNWQKYVAADKRIRAIRSIIEDGRWTDFADLGLPVPALARLEAELEELRRANSELQATIASLHDRVEELEEEIEHAREEAMAESVLEELTQCRAELEAAQEQFVAFLQQIFFPVGERYEALASTSENLHERMQRLLGKLGGSIAKREDQGSQVLGVPVPDGAEETFFGPGGSFDQARFDKMWPKLIKQFHSDSVRQFGMAWAVELLDDVTAFLVKQREVLMQHRKAI